VKSILKSKPKELKNVSETVPGDYWSEVCPLQVLHGSEVGRTVEVRSPLL